MDVDALGGGDIMEYRGLDDADSCELSDGCACHLSGFDESV
jgi:hypothetical protein